MNLVVEVTVQRRRNQTGKQQEGSLYVSPVCGAPSKVSLHSPLCLGLSRKQKQKNESKRLKFRLFGKEWETTWRE